MIMPLEYEIIAQSLKFEKRQERRDTNVIPIFKKGDRIIVQYHSLLSYARFWNTKFIAVSCPTVTYVIYYVAANMISENAISVRPS